MGYASILSELVCQEYKSRVGDQYPNRDALMMDFALFQRDGKHIPSVFDEIDNDRRPHYQLMVFGQHNYVGVFIRETVIIPWDKSDWYCIAAHDSCWRTDGVGRFFLMAEEYISTLGNGFGMFADPFYWEELEEDMIGYLRSRAHLRLGPTYVRHPLFEEK